MPHAFRARCTALLSLILPVSLLMDPTHSAVAQQIPKQTLFRNVRVLDVVNGRLSAPTDVLIRGNEIASIASSVNPSADATIVDGHGRTLMPGLIDDHVHLTF